MNLNAFPRMPYRVTATTLYPFPLSKYYQQHTSLHHSIVVEAYSVIYACWPVALYAPAPAFAIRAGASASCATRHATLPLLTLIVVLEAVVVALRAGALCASALAGAAAGKAASATRAARCYGRLRCHARALRRLLPTMVIESFAR